MPPKAAKLPRPMIKVLTKPSPKIGKALWGTNLFILAKKRNRILAKTRGNINKLVFKEALKSSRLAVQMAITNKLRIKIIFVIG